MPAAHILYIPAVLAVGFVLGWLAATRVREVQSKLDKEREEAARKHEASPRS